MKSTICEAWDVRLSNKSTTNPSFSVTNIFGLKTVYFLSYIQDYFCLKLNISSIALIFHLFFIELWADVSFKASANYVTSEGLN